MIYKNLGHTTRTFHGVTFNPGDTKEVNGYINAKEFVAVDKLDTVSDKKEPEKEDKKEDKRSKDNKKVERDVKVTPTEDVPAQQDLTV